MEISKIVIKNFKGIEHVELSPVKPINVLIGRNNSGKSSVITCLNFLHEYFGPNNAGNTIKVPARYFREGLDKKPEMKISIFVEQSKEERKEQFIRAKDSWQIHNDPPRLSDAAISAQLENDLFSILTLNFVAPTISSTFRISVNKYNK